MTEATASGGVALQGKHQIVSNREQAIFVELALSNAQHVVHKIDITHHEPHGLADPQTCSVQQKQKGLHGVRL